MKISEASLSGILIIELDIHADERGFFVERYRESSLQLLAPAGGFCQDNHSRSAPGVLRGLHYQREPEQGKLVGVVRGAVWDVVVDIRPTSSTYGRHFGVELTDREPRLIWIPPGFAHGFCVLGDEPADLLYKVDAPYNPRSEGGILWRDPELAIPWPTASPILSARDRALPTFEAYRRDPVRWRALPGPTVPGTRA
jgi:dTDP-4-dehydrorhamnose 3,5-epimerase